MTIRQYDKVRLRDGRTCTIVEILKEDTAYIVDIDLPGPDWETIEIERKDILEVL